MHRRDFVRAGLGALLGGAWGCGGEDGPTRVPEPVVPRLSARPGVPDTSVEPGLTELGLGAARDGLLSVPPGYDPDQEWPFFVALHGAGGEAVDWRRFMDLGSEMGVVMLVPESRGGTWDVINGGFGHDVTFLDQALDWAFRRIRVDPRRLCLGGFSDGASYALSLGLPNGDLFSHLVAFSPGFLVSTEERGLPEVFISHGTRDPILSFSGTQGQIVPLLQQAGYDVTFRQFDGGHEVPAEVATAALDWLLR